MIINSEILFSNYNGFISGVITLNGNLEYNDISVLLFDSFTLGYLRSEIPIKGHYIFEALNINKKYMIIVKLKNNKTLCISDITSSTSLTYTEQINVKMEWRNNIFNYIHEKPVSMNIEPILGNTTDLGTFGYDIVSGYVEGIDSKSSHQIKLITNTNTITQITITSDFNFNNIRLDDASYIIVDSKITPISYYTTKPQVKGYITGSVNTSCDGTNFKIRVYREDGFFIGDYDIAENGMYEIPNLNIHSSYDVLLYDLNLAVETKVNSRRVPTAYNTTS